jgi:asparagine synthase (glutamine-hydrolysing)
MCGITGYVTPRDPVPGDPSVLERMTNTLVHRGPDSGGMFLDAGVALGFRRLSIIDLEGGQQPLRNEDETLVLLCNGEIYNYRALRHELLQRGHRFRTGTDVEVILHLYEELGTACVGRLNGQFAFALYDTTRRSLFLARDHFGVCPLYYADVNGTFVFGSEIKAILEHPAVDRAVDLTGLDQVMSFPGLISPRTMYKGVSSVKSGHYLTVDAGGVRDYEYWDLSYPVDGEVSYDKPEQYYVERLSELLYQSVRYRLQADVPVGFYLSGGLDSSLIGAVIQAEAPTVTRHSFSIAFEEARICESKYRQLMRSRLQSTHHEIVFGWSEIASRMQRMIYHAECPVKESYNSCSLALSEAARTNGVPVVLTGEGADELFAGYVGYRFDRLGQARAPQSPLLALLEEELREQLWGDKNVFYDIDQYSHRDVKCGLYSAALRDGFESFECLAEPLVNTDRVRGRHPVHQRSYLDFKLRLADHLVADHGDRMALANSVEARYPFLDIALVEFSREIPPDLKLRGFTEKYILRRVADRLVPSEILNREKFVFHAPGAPYLLQHGVEWVHDLLSYDRIRRQGYFDPDAVERLKTRYAQPGFALNLPFETDELIVVMTFGLLLSTFDLPGAN